jgi:uncharacterized membrane protein
MTWAERVKAWLAGTIAAGGAILPKVPKNLKPKAKPKAKPDSKPKPKPNPSKPTQEKPKSSKAEKAADWAEDIAESIGGQPLKKAIQALKSEKGSVQFIGAIALFLILIMLFRKE